MNKAMIAGLISVLISLSASAQELSWSAQSTERQGERSSEIITKSSQAQLSELAATMQADKGSIKQRSLVRQASAALSLSQRSEFYLSNHEFWIYDAWVTLRNDLDDDGYVYRFSLEFDADTIYTEAPVYARLYLAVGEVFKEYHTTSVFTIMGENTDDSFVVDSELLSGFPSGDYELLIELYDADTEELVATLDGNDDPDLYLLTLESKDFEYTNTVVVEGGSLGWWSLCLLPLLAWRRYAKQV